MKKIKYLIMIALALVISGSVFIACNSSIPEDHSTLLRKGYIYRVTYNANGGNFSGTSSVHIYYTAEDFGESIRAANPSEKDKEFNPTNYEQFISGWFYRDVTQAVEDGVNVNRFEKRPWVFESNLITKDMLTEKVDEKTGIKFYDFELFADWEYYLYIDYSISYVEMDKESYIGTLSGSSKTTDPKSSLHTVVSTDVSSLSKIYTYDGRGITHSTGTAVPEEYDPVKHAYISKAQDVRPMYYADPQLTQRITFPLDSEIAPKSQKGQNHIRVYVKFFDEKYNIIATPNDLSTIRNENYYLWRSVDFSPKLTGGTAQRKTVTASELFEGKSFLGNGFTMSNLAINSNQPALATSDTPTPASTNLGMFGRIINSEISDVTFDNCVIYFNMNYKISAINCGLLAGTIDGDKTSISKVKFTNTQGYIRNDKASIVYDARFNSVNGFIYNQKGNVSAPIDVNPGGASIKYMNVFIQVADAKDEDPNTIDSGYTVWSRDDVAGKDLSFELGNFNEMLNLREAGDSGRESGYYVTLDIFLTEIDGVKLSIFGEADILASEYFSKANETDSMYAYRIYVPERIKAGKIIVKWNEELVDEYKYLVFGGSGNISLGTNLKLSGGESLTATYDNYTQTLTYKSSTGLNYYEPATAPTGSSLKDRPAGYSIPVRMRLYAKIAEGDAVGAGGADVYKDIKITINGIEYDIKDLGFKTITSGGDRSHYVEFWQPIDKDNPNAEVIVSFYQGRYAVRFQICADGDVKFNPQAVAQTALTVDYDTMNIDFCGAAASQSIAILPTKAKFVL